MMLGVAPVALALWLPMGARGQLATSVDSVSASNGVGSDRFYPDYRKGREITLAGVGAGSLVTGLLVSVDFPDVPAQGLDLADIAWSVDRGVVGNNSVAADAASSWARSAAVVFPFALGLAIGQEDGRWRGFGHRSLVYAETFLISQGVTLLGKTTLGRARPFAYLSAQERPDDPAYDVSRERTFYSMPSGHSSSAWTGAALGMTEHLLRRPDRPQILGRPVSDEQIGQHLEHVVGADLASHHDRQALPRVLVQHCQ